MAKTRLKNLLFAATIIGIMFALTQTAMAAGTFRTTNGVNIRSEAALDASVLRTVSVGSNVEVLEHNPAGWSRVRVGNTTGFIRSDFLEVPTGSRPATLRTTYGVNMRSEAALDASVLRVVDAGAKVEVLTHNPAAWSRVRVGGTEGFIRSDFLTTTGVQAPQSSTASSNANANSSTPAASTASVNMNHPVTLWTTANANVRSSASPDADVVTMLDEGTAVSVVALNPSAWARVQVNGATGYIRNDLLRGNVNNVELLEWSVVRGMLRDGQVVHITDVRTGRTYNVRIFTRGRHADVEAATQADSDTIRSLNGGNWSWDRRPVWVTFDGRTVAASINAMPHGRGAVQGNGMNGHICLHFLGSENHNGSTTSPRLHRAMVLEAFAAGG
ncbi:MAG: SH3 domain-containing protein [Oscillospiraceae bacterium]|nr:SH3 domain-containing protein [Oscillospiraceae bacterium]